MRNKTRSTVPSRSRHTRRTHHPQVRHPSIGLPHRRTRRGPATAKTGVHRCNTLLFTLPSHCHRQQLATPHPTADPPNTQTRVRPAQRTDLDHCTLAHADLTLTKIHRKTSILRRPCHSQAAWRGQEPTTSQCAALLLTMPAFVLRSWPSVALAVMEELLLSTRRTSLLLPLSCASFS